MKKVFILLLFITISILIVSCTNESSSDSPVDMTTDSHSVASESMTSMSDVTTDESTTGINVQVDEELLSAVRYYIDIIDNMTSGESSQMDTETDLHMNPLNYNQSVLNMIDRNDIPSTHYHYSLGWDEEWIDRIKIWLSYYEEIILHGYIESSTVKIGDYFDDTFDDVFNYSDRHGIIFLSGEELFVNFFDNDHTNEHYMNYFIDSLGRLRIIEVSSSQSRVSLTGDLVVDSLTFTDFTEGESFISGGFSESDMSISMSLAFFLSDDIFAHIDTYLNQDGARNTSLRLEYVDLGSTLFEISGSVQESPIFFDDIYIFDQFQDYLGIPIDSSLFDVLINKAKTYSTLPDDVFYIDDVYNIMIDTTSIQDFIDLNSILREVQSYSESLSDISNMTGRKIADIPSEYLDEYNDIVETLSSFAYGDATYNFIIDNGEYLHTVDSQYAESILDENSDAYSEFVETDSRLYEITHLTPILIANIPEYKTDDFQSTVDYLSSVTFHEETFDFLLDSDGLNIPEFNYDLLSELYDNGDIVADYHERLVLSEYDTLIDKENKTIADYRKLDALLCSLKDFALNNPQYVDIQLSEGYVLDFDLLHQYMALSIDDHEFDTFYTRFYMNSLPGWDQISIFDDDPYSVTYYSQGHELDLSNYNNDSYVYTGGSVDIYNLYLSSESDLFADRNIGIDSLGFDSQLSLAQVQQDLRDALSECVRLIGDEYSHLIDSSDLRSMINSHYYELILSFYEINQ